jgi:hypothetical protein
MILIMIQLLRFLEGKVITKSVHIVDCQPSSSSPFFRSLYILIADFRESFSCLEFWQLEMVILISKHGSTISNLYPKYGSQSTVTDQRIETQHFIGASGPMQR